MPDSPMAGDKKKYCKIVPQPPIGDGAYKKNRNEIIEIIEKDERLLTEITDLMATLIKVAVEKCPVVIFIGHNLQKLTRWVQQYGIWETSSLNI